MQHGFEDTLAQCPVFAGLRADQLERIGACARTERGDPGTMLLRQGLPADVFYVIRHGLVSLEIQAPGRGPLRIETLQDGDVLGLSWLFAPYRWQFDGRVIEPCSLIAINGACLRGKCEQDHELGFVLMRRFAGTMVERLQATRVQLLDVYGNAGS